MVTQETFLFSGSVADNIALRPAGRHPGADRGGGARRSARDEFIAALPEGYDTDVRKRGGRLSAGQRQLVAFARAFLADPAVLILDEATSSLDIPSERAVQRALRTVLADRTALIIAHRLSTVEIADRVLVMEAGRIVEDGVAGRADRRRRPVRRAAPGLAGLAGLRARAAGGGHRDGGGGGDVERVDAGRHRDADPMVGGGEGLGRQAGALGAEQQRQPRRGRVHVRQRHGRRVRGEREHGEAGQRGAAARGQARQPGERDPQHVAHRDPHRPAVERVGAARAEQHRVHPERRRRCGTARRGSRGR